MSGPKYSQFQLDRQRSEEERRRIEEEIRQKELRRIEEERRLEAERREKEAKERREREEYNISYNADLEKRVAELREKMFKKREQEIIAEAIDEAMEEMGYDLIASTDRECEAPVQAQVFSFSEGVGVQVIENAGRISMEIVGIGTNNRKPTESESAYLETKMVDFCQSYQILEQKLRQKGIVKAEKIHHFPPDKKYARILNVDNFAQKKEATTLQMHMKETTEKAKGNLQATKKKQMVRTKE